MRLALPLAVLLLAGCPKDPELPASVSSDQLAAPPRLPAPRAGTYARVVATPKDPVVRAILGDRTYDASLGGTATGLALPAVQDSGGFTRREIRRAAWDAGYPWPILSVGAWPTNEAGAPPSGVRAWLAEQPASRDVGIVRARDKGEDLWVGVAGRAQVRLGVVPREVAQGYTLRLPPTPNAVLRTSDGTGGLQEQPLDAGAEIVFDVPGEWVVQIADDGGDLARFALHVDTAAPVDGVLPARNIPVASASKATERARYLVQYAREAYGVAPVTWDPILARAAEAVTDTDDPLVRVRPLGSDPDLVVGFRCTARTVEDCLDSVVWDPRHRRVFVDERPWAGGLDVRWTSSKVTIVGLFAGE